MAFAEMCCRSGGDNRNAGTLNGSAEPSTSAPVSYTNGAWNSSTKVFTPASGNPVSDGVLVGHFVSVFLDAASLTGYVAVVSAVSSTTITLNGNLYFFGTAPTTAASGMSARVGGAWAGPSGSVAFPFNVTASTFNNTGTFRINLKNDQTYAITATMTANGTAIYSGYATTYGDGGKSTVDGGTSGTSFILLTNTATTTFFTDLIFQNNGATGSANLVNAGSGIMYRCVFRHSRGAGLQQCMKAVACEAYDCNQSNTSSLGAFHLSNCYGCISHHNNAGTNCSGFTPGNNQTHVNCIAAANSGWGFLSNGTVFWQCTAYGNTQGGFKDTSGNTTGLHVNSLIEANTGAAFNGGGVPLLLLNLATFGNGSSGIGSLPGNIDFGTTLTLAAAPTNSPTTGDFSLKSSSAAKYAGYAPSLLSLDTGDYSAVTPSYPSIGASSSKGSTVIVTED